MNYPSPNRTPLALVPCADCRVLLAPCEAVCLVGLGLTNYKEADVPQPTDEEVEQWVREWNDILAQIEALAERCGQRHANPAIVLFALSGSMKVDGAHDFAIYCQKYARRLRRELMASTN